MCQLYNFLISDFCWSRLSWSRRTGSSFLSNDGRDGREGNGPGLVSTSPHANNNLNIILTNNVIHISLLQCQPPFELDNFNIVILHCLQPSLNCCPFELQTGACRSNSSSSLNNFAMNYFIQ